MAVVAGQHIGCIMFPSKAMLVQMRAQSHAHFRLEPLQIIRKSITQNLLKASCQLCSPSFLIERCPCLYRHLRTEACLLKARSGRCGRLLRLALSGPPPEPASYRHPSPASAPAAAAAWPTAPPPSAAPPWQRNRSAAIAQPAVFPCDPAVFFATYCQVTPFSCVSLMLMLCYVMSSGFCSEMKGKTNLTNETAWVR